MSGDSFHKALRKAWEEQKDMPSKERFERMVARGAIDRQGRVLLRYPMKPDDGATAEEPCVCRDGDRADPDKTAAPPLNGVVETALYVDDMDRSARFYETVFGFSVIVSGDRLKAMSVAQWPQVLLLFKKGASARMSPSGHDGDGRLHLAFAIDVARLEDWERHLHERGVAVEEKKQWERGGWSLYFRDPDQHLIELVTPGVWLNY